MSVDVSLAKNTSMKQDMLNGFAALVFDFTLPTEVQDSIKTDPSSMLSFDSINLTTSCLSESPYVFPGWEGVPLDGFPPAQEI